MESIAEHVLEPELLVPVPRRLRLPARTRLLLSVAALLLGLCAFGSGRALWEGVKLLDLDIAGYTVYGKITAIQTEPSASEGPAPLKGQASSKGQTPRQTALRYAAAVPGPQGAQTQSAWIVLGAPETPPGIENEVPSVPAAHFKVGQAFPLRCASFFGASVCQPWGPNPGSRILSLLLAGSLVLTVSLLLLRRLSRWAGSHRFLLRQGTATIGTITHTRSETEDMMRYFLRYGYAAGGAAAGRDHEEQVSADQWRKFQVGQPVTVLYDPDNPSHAGLYALIVQK